MRSPLFVFLCGLAALGGCNLTGALTYPTLGSGEAAHVAVSGTTAYVALGRTGVEVLDLESQTRVRILPPPAGSGSSDHLCVADGSLFVLDARAGRLSVYSTAEPRAPRLATTPVAVPVGPFSGVSAAGGRVIVSGGTSELTVLTYDASGRVGARATTDLGRGQPEVQIAPDGLRAVVSTHFSGAEFGVTTLRVPSPPEGPVAQGRLRLEAAGFTPGGSKPANFPLVTVLMDDRLFVAHGAGLAVVDVTRFETPSLVRVIPLEVRPVAVAGDGTMLAVVGSSPSPRVILLDARSLEVVRSIVLPPDARALDVALTASQVVVAAGPRGALILPR